MSKTSHPAFKISCVSADSSSWATGRPPVYNQSQSEAESRRCDTPAEDSVDQLAFSANIHIKYNY